MPDSERVVCLSGWGRNLSGRSKLVETRHPATAIAAAIHARPDGTVIARGLGRAYGDAALNTGGTVLRPLPGPEPMVIDDEKGVGTFSACLSVGEVLPPLLRRGWMLPAVPGTRHVTLGGAIAADVHGKNHHRDSSLGAWLVDLDLVDGHGREVTLTPGGETSALFWATVGGMGATGVITRVRLRLIPLETSWMAVRRRRFLTLADLLSALSTPGAATYQVAWVDGIWGGGDRRRSILEEGEHAARPDLTIDVRDPLDLSWPAAIPAPGLPLDPFRPTVMRLLNAGWWHRSPETDRQLLPLYRFFFPLDRVASWNRAYGPRGLVQYQFVVPAGSSDLVARALDELNAAGLPPTLTVVKTTGPSTPGPLSFPIPGVTVAVDVADRGDRVRAVLSNLDAAVVAAGGRTYLAKDSTTTPEMVREMYPRLPEWQHACAEVDPHHTFCSDLFRRLQLR